MNLTLDRPRDAAGLPATRPRRRLSRHTRLVTESGLLGLALGVLVVAPWTTGGYLVALDWVSGPHDNVDPGVFGLSYSGLDALPWRLLTEASRLMLGPAVTGWLFVLLPFPIAAAGAAHLVRSGRWPSYAAALMATCTPLVVDRVTVGHVGYLLAISLLPWLASSALDARSRQRWISGRMAGWFALAVALSPHAAWMGGVVLVVVTFARRPTRRDLTRLAVTVAAAVTVYSYAIVSLLTDAPRVAVSDADLTAFATDDGPGGLLPTVLTLHGFWRGGTGQVREVLGPWAVPLAVVVLSTVALGLLRLLRRDDIRGRIALLLIGSGALLAMGAQGPTGAVYAWAFDHVPLFAVMREPAKWLALVQLGYVLAVAAGVRELQDRLGDATRLRRSLPALVALAPLCILPALGLGLGGRLTTSTYPQSWAAVESLTVGQRGQLLALPWHGYQPYSFTAQRSVATPVSGYFSIPVLQSDSVELGPLRTNSTSPRQQAVDDWVASGGTSSRSLLADLGVTYVMLSRGPEDASYAWLASQPGLSPVLRTDDVELWRVDGTAAATSRVRATSQVSYDVAAGPAGRLVLPQDYAPGWTLDGVPGVATPAGALAFDAGPAAGHIEFTPWGRLRDGIALSLLALLALLVLGLVEHRDDLARVGRSAARR